MSSKICDSCKSATATLFCRADSAFLCISCDSNIHAANKLASRHARVWVCEVCEQAPAHVTCKADAAALCVACDRDIHSVNPLARRHERVPITPFYDAVSSATKQPKEVLNFLDLDERDADAVSREEAEAESWLLPNPKVDSDLNSGQFLFSDVDPYLDLEFGPVDPKIEAQEQNSSGTDGVVPVQSEAVHHHPPHGGVGEIVNDQCFDLEFSKPFAYTYTTQCLSQSVSSSSMEVGVVPDGSNTTDVTNPFSKTITNGFDSSLHHVASISSVDREAKVMRYREKRKNRKFEKTIRYASRKAYAETRPRIKGRFAKRSDPEVDADRVYGYGVVPSF